MTKKLVHVNIPEGYKEDYQQLIDVLCDDKREMFQDYEFLITCGKPINLTVDATPILEEIRDFLKQIQANTSIYRDYKVGDSSFPTK